VLSDQRSGRRPLKKSLVFSRISLSISFPILSLKSCWLVTGYFQLPKSVFSGIPGSKCSRARWKMYFQQPRTPLTRVLVAIKAEASRHSMILEFFLFGAKKVQMLITCINCCKPQGGLVAAVLVSKLHSSSTFFLIRPVENYFCKN